MKTTERDKTADVFGSFVYGMCLCSSTYHAGCPNTQQTSFSAVAQIPPRVQTMNSFHRQFTEPSFTVILPISRLKYGRITRGTTTSLALNGLLKDHRG
jgi:hypothetical protein